MDEHIDINNRAEQPEEWLTAAEFAERAGITPVAVYKRFKEGSEFYKLDENGAKRFSSRALELYTHQSSKQNSELNELINVYKNLINDYKTEIADLKTEIEDLISAVSYTHLTLPTKA